MPKRARSITESRTLFNPFAGWLRMPDMRPVPCAALWYVLRPTVCSSRAQRRELPVNAMSTEFDTVCRASLAVPPHLGSFESARHHVLDVALVHEPPEGVSQAIFALGCFWGAERKFWQTPGVHCTAVGYTGGHTAEPDYYSVCSGSTGHAEAVLVSYRISELDYGRLLALFWEAHDPTQGMRQGADVGTQYRSGLFTLGPEQHRLALASRQQYGEALGKVGYGPITTEVAGAGVFHFAERDHQQYLAKNPQGYCGLGGTGVACALDLVREESAMAERRP